MFLAAVITPEPDIAGNAPVFWFYIVVLFDAFQHIATIARK
jgi:hypothetical protein